MQVIKTESIPIYLWLNDIEPEALNQAKNLANLPFAFHHIAIMPDAHPGFGMPIGGVLATTNVIIPNAVGVDIGCGMAAVKTSIQETDKDKLKQILGQIRREIPLGFAHHQKAQNKDLMPALISKMPIIERQYQSALTQIGTLGGGNHFIEIQKDEESFLWLMLHSGSRNLGFQVANFYNDIAVKMNCQKFGNVPKQWQLAYLPVESEEGQSYLLQMQYCVDFALANRKLMMKNIQKILKKIFKKIKFESIINIAHNYASLETHFDKEVWVHRKGATKAFKDEIGIIPGSQGTSSYIVKGKCNPDSFCSCSHGAGRIMGRNQAQRQLDLKTEQSKLDKKGILHAIRGVRDLDEASGAYKNIDSVMQNQQDLVDIVLKLSPLAVVKG